jgi:hypothetical protein
MESSSNTLPRLSADMSLSVPNTEEYIFNYKVVIDGIRMIASSNGERNLCAVCNPDTCQKSADCDDYVMECFDTNPTTWGCKPKWIYCGHSFSYSDCIQKYFACCQYGPGSDNTECC